MKAILCVGLVLSLFQIGCAFKEHPEQKAQSAEPDASSPSPAPSPKWTASVQWQPNQKDAEVVTLKRGIYPTKDEKVWMLSAPVTLPASLPSEVKLQITLPVVSVGLGTLVAKARSAPVAGSSKTIEIPVLLTGAARNTNAETEFDVSIKSLGSALSNNGESEAFITLDIFGDGPDYLVRIYLRLLTPPSALFQMLDQAPSDPGLSALKYLDAPEEMDTLIDYLDLTNGSDKPISIDLPVEMKGKLYANTKFVGFSTSQCSYQVTEDQKEILYADHFKLLPLTVDLADRFLAYTGVQNQVLGAGQSAHYGLFAAGADAREFATHGPSPKMQRSAPVNIPLGCDFRCPRFRGFDEYNQAWNCGGNPRAACEQYHDCMDCMKGGQCSWCRKWDEAFSVDNSFLRACKSDWIVTPILKQITGYSVRDSIMLFLDLSAYSSVTMRFAFSPPNEDPEGRPYWPTSYSRVQWE